MLYYTNYGCLFVFIYLLFWSIMTIKCSTGLSCVVWNPLIWNALLGNVILRELLFVWGITWCDLHWTVIVVCPSQLINLQWRTVSVVLSNSVPSSVCVPPCVDTCMTAHLSRFTGFSHWLACLQIIVFIFGNVNSSRWSAETVSIFAQQMFRRWAIMQHVLCPEIPNFLCSLNVFWLEFLKLQYVTYLD